MIARRTSEIFATAVAQSRAPQGVFGLVVDGALTDVVGVGGATASTRFRIASMTKSFTAALTLLLRDEGVLDLDSSVAALAPELAPLDIATQSAWPGAPVVTLRHLLTMSSGLPEDDPWADRHMDFTASEFEATLREGVVSIFAPGTDFEYSNLGYASVGRVIEGVTGHTAQQLISERLLHPLGMHDTGWTVPDGDVDYARPHRINGDAVEPEPHLPGDGVIAPMGGVWSTVEDLARWVRFLADPTTPGPLLATSRAELHQIYTPFPPDEALPLGGGYGMGLTQVGDRILGPVTGHSGGLPGYGSNMSWLADGSLGAIALANVTYARMFRANRIILRNLIQSRTQSLGAMEALALQLVALLNDWTDAAAFELFADNVDADESFERRAAAAADLIDEHGRLELLVIEPKHGARAIVTFLGPRSQRLLSCELSRSPHAKARIQHYRVTAPS